MISRFLKRSKLDYINFKNRQNINSFRLTFLHYKIRAIIRRRGLKKYVAKIKRKNRRIRYFRKHWYRVKLKKRRVRARRKSYFLFKKQFHANPIMLWFICTPVFIKTKANLALMLRWIKQLKKRKQKHYVVALLKERKVLNLINKSLITSKAFSETTRSLSKIYLLLKTALSKRIKSYLNYAKKNFLVHSFMKQSYQARYFGRRLFNKKPSLSRIFRLKTITTELKSVKKSIKQPAHFSKLNELIPEYFLLKKKKANLLSNITKFKQHQLNNHWRYKWQLSNFSKKIKSPHYYYTKRALYVLRAVFELFARKMKQPTLDYPYGYNFAIKTNYYSRFLDKYNKYNIRRHRKIVLNSLKKKARARRKVFWKVTKWNRRLYRMLRGWFFNIKKAQYFSYRRRIKRLRRFTWRIFKARRSFNRPLHLRFPSIASRSPHLLHMFAFWRRRVQNLTHKVLPAFRGSEKRSLKILYRSKLFSFKHIWNPNKLALFPFLISNCNWFARIKINSFKSLKQKARNFLFKIRMKLKTISRTNLQLRIKRFLRVKRFLRKPDARHAGFMRLPGMRKIRNRRRRSKRHLYFNRFRIFKLQLKEKSFYLKSTNKKKNRLSRLNKLYTYFIRCCYSFISQNPKRAYTHLLTPNRLIEAHTRFVLLQRLFTNLYKRYDWPSQRFFFKPWIRSIGEKQLPLLKNLYFKVLNRSTLAAKASSTQTTLFRYLRYIVLRARHRNMWLTVVNPDGTVAFSESFGTLGFNTKKSKKSLRLPTQTMFEKFKKWFNHDCSVITGSWYELKLKSAPTSFRLRKYINYWLRRTVAFGQNPTILGRTGQRQLKLNRLRTLLVFNEKELSIGESFIEKTLPLLVGLPLLIRKKFLSRYSQYRKNYTVLTNIFLSYLQKRCILRFGSSQQIFFRHLVSDLLSHPVIFSKLRFVAKQCKKSIFSLWRLVLERGKFLKLLNQFSDTRKIVFDYFRNYRKPRKLRKWLTSFKSLNYYDTFLNHRKTKGKVLFRRRRRRYYRKKRYFKLASHKHRTPIIRKFTRWTTNEHPFSNIAIRIVKIHLNIPLSHGAVVKQKKAKRK